MSDPLRTIGVTTLVGDWLRQVAATVLHLGRGADPGGSDGGNAVPE